MSEDNLRETVQGDEDTGYIDPEEDAMNAKETVRDMALGLVVCAVVFAAAGSLLMLRGWYRWVLGVVLGAAAAGLMLWHLYVSIDRALDMDEDSANKYMKKSAIQRILIAAAAFVIGAFLPKVFHIFGVLAGGLSLKFAAYLQPLTHKAINYLNKGR